MAVPKLKEVRTVATTRFFRIEEMDLRFANGEERTYERLAGGGRAAVIVVAVNDADELLLIREYCAGFHEMQLTLVKGASDLDESLEDAIKRDGRDTIESKYGNLFDMYQQIQKPFLRPLRKQLNVLRKKVVSTEFPWG